MKHLLVLICALGFLSGCSGSSGSGSGSDTGTVTPSNKWVPFTTSAQTSDGGIFYGVYNGKLIQWAGRPSAADAPTGQSYDFNTQAWTTLSSSGGPQAANSSSFTIRGIYGDYMMAYGNATYGGGIFNLRTGSWTTFTPVGTIQNYPSVDLTSALTIGDKFFFYYTSLNGAGADCLERGIYDSSGHCSPISTSGAPSGKRRRMASVWTGSKVFLWGGYDGTLVTNDGYLYDVNSDTWTSTSQSSLAARQEAGVGYNNGKILVFGGYANINPLYSDAEIYDVNTDQWTAVTSTNAPPALYNMFVKAIGTTKFLIIGQRAVSPNDVIGSIYDFSNDTWTSLPTENLPAADINYMIKSYWDGTRVIVITKYSLTEKKYSGAFYYP